MQNRLIFHTHTAARTSSGRRRIPSRQRVHVHSAGVVVRRVVRELLSAHAAPKSRAKLQVGADADLGAELEEEQNAGPCPRMSTAGPAPASQQCSSVDSNLQKGCGEEFQLLRVGFFLEGRVKRFHPAATAAGATAVAVDRARTSRRLLLRPTTHTSSICLSLVRLGCEVKKKAKRAQVRAQIMAAGRHNLRLNNSLT